MKRFMPAVILCLLPLSAVSILFYCLETYNSVVHNDCGTLICFYCIISFIISLIIWKRIKSKWRFMTCIFVVSTLILCAVFYVGNKIPFCVECDHVTAEDLGFLQHWISPMQ